MTAVHDALRQAIADMIRQAQDDYLEAVDTADRNDTGGASQELLDSLYLRTADAVLADPTVARWKATTEMLVKEATRADHCPICTCPLCRVHAFAIVSSWAAGQTT